jgi:hypothetical protein
VNPARREPALRRLALASSALLSLDLVSPPRRGPAPRRLVLAGLVLLSPALDCLQPRSLVRRSPDRRIPEPRSLLRCTLDRRSPRSGRPDRCGLGRRNPDLLMPRPANIRPANRGRLSSGPRNRRRVKLVRRRILLARGGVGCSICRPCQSRHTRMYRSPDPAGLGPNGPRPIPLRVRICWPGRWNSGARPNPRNPRTPRQLRWIHPPHSHRRGPRPRHSRRGPNCRHWPGHHH